MEALKWYHVWPGSEQAAEALEHLKMYETSTVTSTRAHRVRRDFFRDFPDGMTLEDLEKIPDAAICAYRACVRRSTLLGDTDRRELLELLKLGRIPS